MTSYSCSIEPGQLGRDLDPVFARLARIRFADALWQRRLDVWGADPEVRARVATRLGWLSAVDAVRPEVGRIQQLARGVRAEGFTHIVLLGMGGSSLAPEVLRQVLGQPGTPVFRMLDSVDPVAVREAFANADTSLFVLASKSGTTIEPTVMAAEARRRVEAAGHRAWGTRFIAITDPETALHRRAVADGFRAVFLNPPDIGGRYSALSLFGMVPAGLMGLSLEALVGHADAMARACAAEDPRDNPGLSLGVFMATAAAAGRDKLTLVLPDALAALGLWVEQLVAESTGKQGTGIVPVTGEPVPPRYGNDRAVVVVETAADQPDPATVASLRAAGAPILTIRMTEPNALGAEFFRWEMATATAGFLLGVNPFDEPNVRQAKDATTALLQAYDAAGELPMPEHHATQDGIRMSLSAAARLRLGADDPRRFLSLVGEGDYLGVLAYLPPSNDEASDILEQFRAAVGRTAGTATMLGYGPRYLHSTGQLHKGGAPNGLFVVVSVTPAEDLSVPGESFTFGVLERAQALGDFASLDTCDRRALLIQLPSPDPALLSRALFALLPR